MEVVSFLKELYPCIVQFHSLKVLLTILATVKLSFIRDLSMILSITKFTTKFIRHKCNKVITVPLKYRTISLVPIQYCTVFFKGISLTLMLLDDWLACTDIIWQDLNVLLTIMIIIACFGLSNQQSGFVPCDRSLNPHNAL